MRHSATPPAFPLPLTRVAAPFSHGDWLFELKYDGFRALAYIEDGDVSLVSRRGNAYKSFPLLTAPPQYKITDDVFASAVEFRGRAECGRNRLSVLGRRAVCLYPDPLGGLPLRECGSDKLSFIP